MKKTKLMFIALLITLITNFSCSNDDLENLIVPADNFKIENYHGSFGQYRTDLTVVLSDNEANLVKFEYDDQDRIIKRVGDLLTASSQSGLGGIMSDRLYISLNYTGNEVKLERKIVPNSTTNAVPGDEKTITFDTKGKMIRKISYEEYNDPQIDTTHFNYDNNGKLISYLKTSNEHSSPDWDTRRFEESNLYYSNNNLDSIVTIKSFKWSDEPYTILQNKKTQHFGGYDNVENPFRKLQIFEETFNRSLNRNNFTEYRKTSNSYLYPNNDFSQSPNITQTHEDFFQNWSFAYDENGELIYNGF